MAAPRPDLIARRRFRCAVKVALPAPPQRGLGLYDFHEQLRRLFGRDGYALVPSAWDGTREAMAVLFDDPAKAFYVAAWADARWPRPEPPKPA
ncbi:hypothetical protein [Roseiterribacter gracilis]|uniref:Uncharacterized protein n=1 Tax=Roseiterribacter gracilis TaxID=2812848 RepID=A0A8S8XEQ7_9PROT|nr:hypothetical protein TMPK1_21340 [Rhodospirillales bacterium TMPK1]